MSGMGAAVPTPPPARQQGPTVPRHVVEAVAASLGYDPADVLSILLDARGWVEVLTVDRDLPVGHVHRRVVHRHGIA